jgi:hypothetical protein
VLFLRAAGGKIAFLHNPGDTKMNPEEVTTIVAENVEPLKDRQRDR